MTQAQKYIIWNECRRREKRRFESEFNKWLVKMNLVEHFQEFAKEHNYHYYKCLCKAYYYYVAKNY